MLTLVAKQIGDSKELVFTPQISIDTFEGGD